MSWFCFTGAQQGECWLALAGSTRHRLPIKQEMEVKDGKVSKPRTQWIVSSSFPAPHQELRWMPSTGSIISSKHWTWHDFCIQNRILDHRKAFHRWCDHRTRSNQSASWRHSLKLPQVMDRRIMLEQVFNVSSLIFVWYESPEVAKCVSRLLSTEHLVKWRSPL